VTTHRQWAELLHAVSDPAADLSSHDVLQRAVELGLDVAPETVGCSVTAIDGDKYHTPVYYGDISLDLDRAQYRAGDGPCMAAARQHRHQHFDAITDRDRFPSFTEAALGRGVHSSISLPLSGTDQPAAVNLYASSRTAFDDERPRAVAGLLARCLSTLLARPDLPVRPAEPEVSTDDIKTAQASARLIVSAEEALMSRQQLSRTAALNRLMGRSRAENRSIFQIAQETVDAARTGVTP
jgi:GAF domain